MPYCCSNTRPNNNSICKCYSDNSGKYGDCLIKFFNFFKFFKKVITYYGTKESPLNPNQTVLDQNHSHFILIDDDSHDDILRQEIVFRTRLEKELRNCWTKYNADGINISSRRNSLTSITSDGIKNKELENEAIPSILICINGQFDSLLLVKEFLREKVSVLVMAVRS